MKAELGKELGASRCCVCAGEGFGDDFLGYSQVQEGGGDEAVLCKEKLLGLVTAVEGTSQIP